MYTIRYSNDKQYYWIEELATSRDFWLSTRTYLEQPKLEWISDAIQYDGEYFRVILYFTFWKVRDRLDIKQKVANYNGLVRDYRDAQRLLCKDNVRRTK